MLALTVPTNSRPTVPCHTWPFSKNNQDPPLMSMFLPPHCEYVSVDHLRRYSTCWCERVGGLAVTMCSQVIFCKCNKF